MGRNCRPYIGSYVVQSAVQAGSTAAAAADRKCAKYSSLSPSHFFIPVAVKTVSPLADDAHHFIKEIGRRMLLNIADSCKTAFH